MLEVQKFKVYKKKLCRNMWVYIKVNEKTVFAMVYDIKMC